MRELLGAWRRLGIAVAVITAFGVSLATAAAGSAAATATPQLVAPTVCGQVSHYIPVDPGGLVKKLPAAVQTYYGQWQAAISPNPWANFKGKKPPWKVGYIDFPIVNQWQADALSELKHLVKVGEKEGLIKSLTTYIQPNSSTATPEQQIAAIQQMVRQGVNFIILHELNSAAEAPAIDAAGKAGVPIITMNDLIPTSKYAINMVVNNVGPSDAATLAQAVKSGLIGNGKTVNVLRVDGIPTIQIDQNWTNEGTADMKPCSGLTVLGTVTGAWSSATAKSQVLSFLASHPQPIGLVMQNGDMAAPIIQAFEQANRPVPLITEGNPNAGDIAYWAAHKSTFNPGFGLSLTGFQTMYLDWDILTRVVDGKGLKISDMAIPAVKVTSANVSKFATKGASLNSPLEASGASGAALAADATDLNGFFKKSGTPFKG